MESSQMIVLLSVLLAAGVLVAVYVSLRSADHRQLILEREAVQDTVSRFRLSKMLAYVGIRPEDYVTNLPNEEISRHVVNCLTCPSIPTCDHCFNEGVCSGDMKFCPNYEALVSYRKLMPVVGE